MVIGLTGGIGSGKSTALKIFESLGVPTYQADIEAKKIMQNSKVVRDKIIKLLGKESYHHHELNRVYIAQKVFKNKELLNGLNAIVHPSVHKHFKDFVFQQKLPYLVYENAILYENNNEELCDKVIVIAADLEERIFRVMKRDGITREDVLNRMNNQWSQDEKIKKADYVFYNISQKELKKEIEQIHQQLLKINDI